MTQQHDQNAAGRTRAGRSAHRSRVNRPRNARHSDPSAATRSGAIHRSGGAAMTTHHSARDGNAVAHTARMYAQASRLARADVGRADVSIAHGLAVMAGTIKTPSEAGTTATIASATGGRKAITGWATAWTRNRPEIHRLMTVPVQVPVIPAIAVDKHADNHIKQENECTPRGDSM